MHQRVLNIFKKSKQYTPGPVNLNANKLLQSSVSLTLPFKFL
jgi:hypothetical protein